MDLHVILKIYDKLTVDHDFWDHPKLNELLDGCLSLKIEITFNYAITIVFYRIQRFDNYE